jgi:hypothetical protein
MTLAMAIFLMRQIQLIFTAKVGLYTVQTVSFLWLSICIYVDYQGEKGYSLVMPTAFSPNGDGINDSFSPVFGLIEMTLHVYDTWVV